MAIFGTSTVNGRPCHLRGLAWFLSMLGIERSFCKKSFILLVTLVFILSITEVELRKNFLSHNNPLRFPDTKLQVYVGSKPKVCTPYIDTYCAVVPILPLVKCYQTYIFRAVLIFQYIRKTSPTNRNIFPLSMGKPETNKALGIVFQENIHFLFLL